MNFQLKLEFNGEVSAASVDSLREQLLEVVAEALSGKEIEIPDAEIVNCEIILNDDPGFLD